MEITVTCRHPGINSQMKAYAEEKVGRVTRIFDRLTSAQVTLDIEGAAHRAEASVHAPRGATLVAHASGQDMFRALDELEHRLEGQLRRLKDRYIARRHGSDLSTA